MNEPLTADERRELLQRAHAAGARALGLGSAVETGAAAGRLADPGASFVTWKRDGRLRGCIGSVEAVRPLAEDVENNAVMALLHDPRFPPATAREFPRYVLEISVLTPFAPVADVSEIRIGEHGLYIEKGRRRGLLLPQVPVEWGWDVPQFLEQLCLKAGLPPDAWATGAALSKFSAEVFGAE